MAATTGLLLPSIAASTLWRSGGRGGLPNSRMSAPAMKVRPAPMMTMASTAESATPWAMASRRPWRTPWESALTGGLFTVMTPTLPCLSNVTRSLTSGVSRSVEKALRRLHQAFGKGRMRVDGHGEVFRGHRGLDGQGGLGDQLSRSGPGDADTEHASRGRVHDELGESVAAPDGRRAARGGPGELRDLDGSPRLLRLRFHEAAPGDLGIGEHHRGHRDVVEGRRAPRNTLGGHLALAHGAVGEHGLAGQVPHGIDMRIARAAALVHQHESPIAQLDLRGLESQRIADRATAHRHQDAIEAPGRPDLRLLPRWCRPLP